MNNFSRLHMGEIPESQSLLTALLRLGGVGEPRADKKSA